VVRTERLQHHSGSSRRSKEEWFVLQYPSRLASQPSQSRPRLWSLTVNTVTMRLQEPSALQESSPCGLNGTRTRLTARHTTETMWHALVPPVSDQPDAKQQPGNVAQSQATHPGIAWEIVTTLASITLALRWSAATYSRHRTRCSLSVAR